MTGLENFLFTKFTDLPLPARVIAYFIILFLFGYLLLVPRFINGELVTSIGSSSGTLPYRGGDLRLHVDGRVFKFKANEDGYFSIPVVSLVPKPYDIEIFHEDVGRWFKVTLQLKDIWSKDLHVVTVANNAPYVSVAESHSNVLFTALASLQRFIGAPDAIAGALYLPPRRPPSKPSLPPPDRSKIQSSTFSAIERTSGRPSTSITNDFPLTGKSPLTYTERIQLIQRLEKEHNLKIPDEHWRHLNNAGELVDYLQKREEWRDIAPGEGINGALPPNAKPTEEPTFKR